jgi:sec1 family domain-containing protein 1
MVSLRDKQISKLMSWTFYRSDLINNNSLDAIKQMLNMNQPLTKTLAAEPVWKILIYDRVGQDIIAPLLSVQELRDMGTTLHM